MVSQERNCEEEKEMKSWVSSLYDDEQEILGHQYKEELCLGTIG
jgi:hypothetical protein